jgi:hypothetical protein
LIDALLTDTEAELLVVGSWDLSLDHVSSVLASASMHPNNMTLLHVSVHQEKIRFVSAFCDLVIKKLRLNGL